jgi:hypothetical protein
VVAVPGAGGRGVGDWVLGMVGCDSSCPGPRGAVIACGATYVQDGAGCAGWAAGAAVQPELQPNTAGAPGTGVRFTRPPATRNRP